MTTYNLAYIKGCFCFEDRTPKDNLRKRFSKTIMDITLRDMKDMTINLNDAILVLHEFRHLTQDLSLTSCFVERELVSRISMMSSLFIKNRNKREPIILINDNYKLNPHYFNEKQVDPLGVLIYTELSFYSKIFLQKLTIPFSGKWLTNISRREFQDISIGYNDLLESNAHFQSLKFTVDKAISGAIFEQESQFNPLKHFPIKISDQGIVSFDRNQIKFNGRYFNPFLLFFASTIHSIWWGDIINYFNKDFPNLSNINFGVNIEVINCLTFYCMIIEVALTIPSYRYLVDSKIDYHPTTRYAYILNYIKTLSREDIYTYSTGKFESLFNSIANKYGWLTYNETNETFNFSKGEGDFQETCITEINNLRNKLKFHELNTTIQFPKMPLLLRNDDFFKVAYRDDIIFFADCPFQNLEHAYFTDHTRFEDEEMNFNKMIDIQKILLKDIANNLCKNALAKSVILGDKLTCPIKAIECPLRGDYCDEINDLNILKKHVCSKCNSLGKKRKTCILLNSINC